MKTVADLKQMMKEPASKEWFAKHGKPKSEALHKSIPKVKGSVAWNLYYHPKEMHKKAEETRKDIGNVRHQALSDKDKSDYQRRTGRGYNE